jgi:amino acid transporter
VTDGRLRRELRFWEAIALSIAIMAPTAAMALNGVGIAALIGRAVPLAFLFALIGVLLVAWGIAQLAREVSRWGCSSPRSSPPPASLTTPTGSGSRSSRPR